MTNVVVNALRTTSTQEELTTLTNDIAHELGFRHYALIHHDILGKSRPGLVDIKDYPDAICKVLAPL